MQMRRREHRDRSAQELGALTTDRSCSGAPEATFFYQLVLIPINDDIPKLKLRVRMLVATQHAQLAFSN
jgi:hypothetical protein